MGIMIKCNNIAIHLSYSEFENIQNNLLKATNTYFIDKEKEVQIINKNNIFNNIYLLKHHNLYGIYLLFEKNIFTSQKSKELVESILLIYSFIDFNKQNCILFYLFLYSALSKNSLYIK